MKRYNLSDIMKRAHYIFNHTFNATFSYCLKKAWAEAKEAAKINEENAKRAAEYKSKYGNRDYRNYRSYYGSRMGRNDWNRDYRNDIRTAINRSASVCNMKF
ncbi:hypothetical protein GAS36_01140 [Phocaeicola vulgatus]|jgi:hypothetical protein|uniref:Uncharacterized protein n=1 Tax=Phocaeicola vulgatus TaxID=821 RepID=A0A6I0IHF7_PHOVU|nr:hypothetical protein [Phocaeicola vulgatus]DAH25991.1 MAG TPA: hypothetical protein [Caudoviricetes sp.]KAB3860229.1 hypothetical protein GAS29_01140 [Phocaeicola vulgatus]KAB3870906.1 hypothetical protein GAS07_00840 [Phocaeicola vulgatus]KAB3872604.1 hypothetical protein GAS14_01660 [Phocaeicola vulgatus]KAB3886961.1 hypothetical protein GAS24_00165 [Phocaeicola vulgatus]